MTTIRRSGQPAFRSRFDRAKSGVFFMPLGAACFLPQGQRGGVRHDPANGCVHIPYSPIFFVSCSLSLLFGFHNDDTEKSGETIATPPQKGGSYRPR